MKSDTRNLFARMDQVESRKPDDDEASADHQPPGRHGANTTNRRTSYNKCKKQRRNLMKDFANLKKKESVARLSHLGEHIRYRRGKTGCPHPGGMGSPKTQHRTHWSHDTSYKTWLWTWTSRKSLYREHDGAMPFSPSQTDPEKVQSKSANESRMPLRNFASQSSSGSRHQAHERAPESMDRPFPKPKAPTGGGEPDWRGKSRRLWLSQAGGSTQIWRVHWRWNLARGAHGSTTRRPAQQPQSSLKRQTMPAWDG